MLDNGEGVKYTLYMEATPMTHETLRFKAGNDPWRRLPDNENSQKYLEKLSHAANVFVLFDSGEAWELECGKIVSSSPFSSAVIPANILSTVHQ
jgi:hypothetical protein